MAMRSLVEPRHERKMQSRLQHCDVISRENRKNKAKVSNNIV